MKGYLLNKFVKFNLHKSKDFALTVTENVYVQEVITATKAITG